MRNRSAGTSASCEVKTGREKDDAAFLQERAAERLHALVAEVAREADAAAGGRLPLEQLGPLGEERLEEGQVLRQCLPRARPQGLAVPERDRRQPSLGPA
jgi:hypothetical protein